MSQPNILINPDTEIRYYSDPGPLEGQSVDFFVPLRGELVTNPGGTRWPNLFGLPYDGTELQFYLKGEPKVREYDPQIFFERASWVAIDYANPKAGGPAGTWEETLEVLRRPVEELLNQVDAALLQANSKLYPANVDPMQGVLYSEAIRRSADGTATQPMLDLLHKHDSLVAAGFQNMERAAELRQQIQAGEAFDLSAGWVNELPA
jgi:hypothetical protein